MQRLFFLITAFFLLTSCAASPVAPLGSYYPRKIENLETVLAEIEERNKTIERHPAWISLATRDFMIKNLDEIPESEYPGYAQYLDDGTLYIIVHPAYYVFFHEHELSYTDENAVDAFLSERVYTSHMRFLQEQERSMRDFLEITSTRKRLVVIILPGNYRYYTGYAYRELPDEFARYVNSVTNGSESVLYLFSEKANKGNLPGKSRKRLLRFIESVDAKTVLVGGGYFGRCVEDFYKDMQSSRDGRQVTVAGEITLFSPEDLNRLDLDDFLMDGKLNTALLREMLNLNKKGSSLKEFLENYREYKTNRSGNRN
jgi:hypothetical protein